MTTAGLLNPITLGTVIASSAVHAPIHVQQNVDEDLNRTIYLNEDRFIKPVNISFMAEIFSRIIDIKELSENWDGQGAQTPDDNVISNSFKFIQKLPETYVQNLKLENIEPTPYGTIVYDWEKNNEIISVEIGTMKIGFFTDFKEGKNFKVDGKLFNENELPEELISAFNLFF